METGDEKGVRMAREALNKARNGAPAQTAEVKESKPKTFFCATCKKPIGKGTMVHHPRDRAHEGREMKFAQRDKTYCAGWALSPLCHGQGYIWQGEDTEDCPTCKGRGVIER